MSILREPQGSFSPFILGQNVQKKKMYSLKSILLTQQESKYLAGRVSVVN